MPAGPLGGMAVLITRPDNQAAELVDAVETAGGEAWRFPVIDIVARDPGRIRADLDASGPSDIVIFVSANAVRYGLAAIGEPPARVAAIGPATAARLGAHGIAVDIRPAGGFTSEHLLADAALTDVAGRTITIVRGDPGRERLAESLARRGAEVRCLPVYSTRPHEHGEADVARVRQAIREGRIGAVTIMSVATFECLLGTLGAEARELLAGPRLVAPGERVIQNLRKRLPGARCVEAPGPGAQPMVDALIASLQP